MGNRDKLEAAKDITAFLTRLGIAKIDNTVWVGIQDLDPATYRALFRLLQTATRSEAKELNSLLEKKVDILRLGSKKAWLFLVREEIDGITK